MNEAIIASFTFPLSDRILKSSYQEAGGRKVHQMRRKRLQRGSGYVDSEEVGVQNSNPIHERDKVIIQPIAGRATRACNCITKEAEE